MRNVLWALALLIGLSIPATAAAQRGGAQPSLPDGEGKNVVEATCTTCHGLRQIMGSAGYDADGWHDLIGTMVALPDAQARSCADLGGR